MGAGIFLSVCFQEIYVVRVVPCRRISAVFQFLCFEHRLPFLKPEGHERHLSRDTVGLEHSLTYIISFTSTILAKIIVGLNNVVIASHIDFH